MDEDDFLRLEKLVKENNEILKGMRRSMRISRFFTVLYWVVIIGVGFGAYYFIQPFIEPFIETGKGIFQNIKEVQDGLDASSLDIPSVFEKIQN